MIYLPDIATKLEKILNGTAVDVQNNNPNGYYYKVATSGFHLDNLNDINVKKNFIPVFIDSIGGSYDAVKDIKRATRTIQLVIYFPVRFKKDFFALDEFLVDTFVGKIVDFEGVTGKCLTNISTPEYGEIQELDLIQFKDWVKGTYNNVLSKTEPYMSMTLSLYVTTNNKDFILGNNISYKLRMNIKGEEKIYEEDAVWTSSGTGVNNSPIAQQLIDTDDYVRNVVNITNYNKSIILYVRNNEFWIKFLELYNNQTFSNLATFNLIKEYRFADLIKSYNFNQVALTVNENIALGELLSVTVTFGDKRSV